MALDFNALMAAFAQMQQQQQQGQSDLFAQKAAFLDPLGKVARGNSRPSGMTDASSWNAMFNTGGKGATPSVNNPGNGFSWDTQWSDPMGRALPQATTVPGAAPLPFTQAAMQPVGNNLDLMDQKHAKLNALLRARAFAP